MASTTTTKKTKSTKILKAATTTTATATTTTTTPKKKKSTKKMDTFQKWPNTFEMEEMITKDLADLQKATVDCTNCPVSMMCMAGKAPEEEGLHTCEKCGAAGYLISSKDSEVKRLLVIDCNKNNFKVKRKVKECELCDGRVMKYDLLGTKTHAVRFYLSTTHAAVGLPQRVEDFKKQKLFWEDQIKQREAEIAKEAAKRAK